MLCYKDRSFCPVKDCQNMECDRNTANPKYFNPDEFWAQRVAYNSFLPKDCEYNKRLHRTKHVVRHYYDLPDLGITDKQA